MTLYIIGLGLGCAKDISIKGLETVKTAEKIFLENYTSVLRASVTELEQMYGKKITPASRELVEELAEEKIILPALKQNIVFLVIGDVFSATTHWDLFTRAKKMGVSVKVMHNASVLTAVSQTGLQLYKFGKTASIPFQEGFETETPYNLLKENKSMGAHTLFLFDIKPVENKFLSIANAIRRLLKIELKRKEGIFKEDVQCIGCARLGCDDQIIKTGTAAQLQKEDFGDPPYCLVVPGKLHFVEEEAIKKFE